MKFIYIFKRKKETLKKYWVFIEGFLTVPSRLLCKSLLCCRSYFSGNVYIILNWEWKDQTLESDMSYSLSCLTCSVYDFDRLFLTTLNRSSSVRMPLFFQSRFLWPLWTHSGQLKKRGVVVRIWWDSHHKNDCAAGTPRTWHCEVIQTWFVFQSFKGCMSWHYSIASLSCCFLLALLQGLYFICHL